MREVLLVGVSPRLLAQVEMSLGLRGFKSKTCQDAIAATHLLNNNLFPMVIVQYELKPISGFEFILWLKQNRATASIMVCGQGIPRHISDFLEALNILVYDQRKQARPQLASHLERGLAPFFSGALAS